MGLCFGRLLVAVGIFAVFDHVNEDQVFFERVGHTERAHLHAASRLSAGAGMAGFMTRPPLRIEARAWPLSGWQNPPDF